jgi:hypothetical protein
MKNILPNTNYSYPSVNYSPSLNTKFYNVYKDIKIVQKAYKKGILDLEIAEYLSSQNNPIDAKAAVINALGWDLNGKYNSTLYKYYLALTYGKTLEKLSLNSLTVDELFCLGYLTIMDNYFHPEKAIPLLEKAAEKRNDSSTIAIILALAKSQKELFSNDWSNIWKITEKVLNNKTLKKRHEKRSY